MNNIIHPTFGRKWSVSYSGEDVCTHGGSDSGAARLLSEAMCRLRKPLESARDLFNDEVRSEDNAYRNTGHHTGLKATAFLYFGARRRLSNGGLNYRHCEES